MNIKIEVSTNPTPWLLTSVLELLHESFKERIEAGLNYGCATFTLEELQSCCQDAILFIAYDESEEVIGVIILRIKNKAGFYYAYQEYVAVSSTCKGYGLATHLFEEALKYCINSGVEFILSTTAVEAESSVRYHLKNGFKIYRLVSFRNRNYYSYCFIRPIKRLRFLNCACLRKPLYIVSYILCKSFKRKDGSYRMKLSERRT